MTCSCRGVIPFCIISVLIFVPVAAKSSTGLRYVVFTLITPIIPGDSTPRQRQDYAETPLTKIDFLQFDELHSLQHSHHECSEKLCSDQELQLCSRQLRLKLLLFIAFISEPPFSDTSGQGTLRSSPLTQPFGGLQINCKIAISRHKPTFALFQRDLVQQPCCCFMQVYDFVENAANKVVKALSEACLDDLVWF